MSEQEHSINHYLSHQKIHAIVVFHIQFGLCERNPHYATMVVYSGEFGTWEDVPLHLGVPVLVGAIMLVAIALWDRATSSLKPLQCSQVRLLLLLLLLAWVV